MAEIVRRLKRRHVLTLAFGAMVGWSWILLTGEWIDRAGVLGAALAILFVGLVMTFIAAVYAELASMFPTNGGEHVYTMSTFGSVISFICSWALLLGYMGVVAFEIVVFPFVLAYLFPVINIGFLWTFEGVDVYLGQVAIGIGIAICITLINVRGIGSSARLQVGVTLLILVAGLVLVGGVFRIEEFARLPDVVGDRATGIFSVIIMLPMMFVGFDIIAQTAQEIDLEPRQIGRLIIASVVCGAVFYAGIVLCVGLILGESVSGIEFPTALAAEQSWNGALWAKYTIILGGIAGILTSWNGFLLGASRLTHEMAKDGQLPGWLARGSLGKDVFAPRRTLWVLCAISCLAPWFGRSTLVWFIDAGSLGVVVAYLLVIAAFIRLRYVAPDRLRPYKVPCGRFAGAIALITTILIGMLYLPGSPSALLWPQEWFIVLVWGLSGAILYRLARKDRKALGVLNKSH